MRYLGNKTKLIPFIKKVIDKYEIKGEVFADLFSGTGSVADSMKGSYSIIANDFLYYSYLLTKAKVLNNDIPKFKKFQREKKENIFSYLNCIEPTPNGNYFIYNNYTPRGNRMFFNEKNGAKIDAIRIEIEEIYKNDLIDENEYSFLIASLLSSVSSIANTSGTFEAFFKFWESRSKKDFIIEPIELNKAEEVTERKIYCEDTNTLVREIEGDIAYIDPPYTVSQYISAYHMLETIARYDYPEITGVGGKRGRGDKNSLYARKNEALSQFEDLFRQIKFKHILVSYSNQGLVPLEELVNLAKKFAKNNKVIVEYMEYQEYQNHRSSNKGNGKKLKECILYFEKDWEIRKSYLNYSGSKDVLMNKIIKELPKSISTFVDVMGGAFNVGANIYATKEVIYNDYNDKIYEIIKYFNENHPDKIIKEIENIIKYYNLEKGGKESYLRLRNDYNELRTPIMLYVLHMYSFQNMIRFNRKLDFNVPVGVAGYSEEMRNRIIEFIPKTETVKLMNCDYKEIDYMSFDKDSVFYFDPPYFITQAAYNDGKRGFRGWNANEESKLLALLSNLDKAGYKFMLSNVLEHRGKEHHILKEWIKNNKFELVCMGKTGWRYKKEEILVKNFRR